MKDNQDELITKAINDITENVSKLLLQDFLKLPSELQMNIILIKSAQLLLANILCQVANNREELEKLCDDQGSEIKELTFNCAFMAFSDKFDLNKH